MILALIFFAIAIYGFIKLLTKTPEQKTQNPYIKKHVKKLGNDQNYRNYLHWCQIKGEIPMEKEVFLKDVESKENEINNLLK